MLWKITPECEKAWTFMKGIPTCMGRARFCSGKDGVKREVMAYTMNAPYKDQPAIPSDLYFMGIVEGCHQNGISSRSVTDALKRTRQEVGKQKPVTRKQKSVDNKAAGKASAVFLTKKENAMKSRNIKTRLAAFGLALLMGHSPLGNLADVHAAETKIRQS